MIENPYQSTQRSSEAAPTATCDTGCRLFRLCLGIAIPIFLLVVLHTIVIDVFFVNRHDPEYIRLLDHYTNHLYILLLFSTAETVVVLGLPLLLYSFCLEFFCDSTIARLLAGLGFGGLAATLQIYYHLVPFTLGSKWETMETCIHILLPVAVLMGVAMSVGRFSCKKCALGLVPLC